MKKLAMPAYRRPSSLSRKVPRSRTEAAVELVRLEFEGARLEREITQVEARARVARLGLDATRARAATVIRHLDAPDGRDDDRDGGRDGSRR